MDLENRTQFRVCLWEHELTSKLDVSSQCARMMEYACRRPTVTQFYFAGSNIKTPLCLVLLFVALSILISRSFFVSESKSCDQHLNGVQARKYLVLHRASRERLDKQAVETVCHTLQDMVDDSMKGLSCREIWAYEVVHLQKLRELGYKLLDFLDDLKRETRDSHNLAATQVLTEVAMTLVLEREVRCITSLDKIVEQNFDACDKIAALDQTDDHAIKRLYDLLEHTRVAA